MSRNRRSASFANLPDPSGVPPLAYLHLSVDDVIEPLRSLFEGRYASVWQQPIFSYLRHLHQRFGAAFSLYAFHQGGAGGWSLDQANDRHAAEFAAASTWLRFGFHAQDASSRYGPGANHEQYAAQHYADVMAALLRMAAPEALDRAPRVHYYTGSLAAVRAWREARWGVRGLLTADDERAEVYYLSAAQRAAVATRGELFDAVERLRLFRTDVRLENCHDPVAVLKRLPVGRRGAHVFTHAQYLDDPTVRARLEAVGSWMRSNEVPGGFPLDHG